MQNINSLRNSQFFSHRFLKKIQFLGSGKAKQTYACKMSTFSACVTIFSWTNLSMGKMSAAVLAGFIGLFTLFTSVKIL